MAATGNRIATPLRTGDADEALKALVRVPLQSQYLKFSQPDTALWRRVRKAWGEPEYVLTVELARNEQGCWDDFHLHVKSAGTLAPTNKPAVGHVNECGGGMLGMRFQTPVALNISVSDDAKLPPAEIVILAVWPGDLKQRVGEAYVDEKLSYLARWVLGAGILLVAAGGLAALSGRGL